MPRLSTPTIHPPPQKVGWIFSQTVAEREHVLSAEEVVQMARWQRACGGRGASAVVSLWEEEDGRTQVHVEAYCVSKQLEDLVADGWVTDAPPESNVLRMRNPKARDGVGWCGWWWVVVHVGVGA